MAFHDTATLRFLHDYCLLMSFCHFSFSCLLLIDAKEFLPLRRFALMLMFHYYFLHYAPLLSCFAAILIFSFSSCHFSIIDAAAVMLMLMLCLIRRAITR